MKLLKKRSGAALALVTAVSMFAACGGDDTTGDGDGDTTASGGMGTTSDTTTGSGGMGTVGSGGMGTVGSGGDTNMGGGGMGGMGSVLDPVDCDGCAVFGLTFTDFSTGTDFEKQYGAAVDMTDTIITVTLTAAMEGNSGGIQVYAKTGDLDGDDNDYKAVYSSWTNLSDATTEMDIVLDLSAMDADESGFTKDAVSYIGINVASGDEGDTLGEVAVYVDSITFSDGSTDDLTFDADVEGFAINTYNLPIEGSTVGHQ